MKIITLAFFILGCVFLSNGVFAHDQYDHKYEFSIGTQVFHHTYEEPDVMENEGWMYGLTYTASYLLSPYWSLILDGMYAQGSVDYSSKNSGTTDNKDNVMTDNRLFLGYTPSTKSKIETMIYFGLGYRYLFTEGDNKVSSTGALFYDRESNYIYIPLGIDIRYDTGSSWDIKGTLEYDLFWFGRQTSGFGYVSGLDDIDNYQYSGYGYRTSIALRNSLSQNIALTIEPFFRYWNIDDSEIIYSTAFGKHLMEPENNTQELGFNISFSYNF